MMTDTDEQMLIFLPLTSHFLHTMRSLAMEFFILKFHNYLKEIIAQSKLHKEFTTI